MKEALINVLNFLGKAWWVEIVTENPRCIYYFGPFGNAQEADATKNGYIEDLQNEGAQGIAVVVKRCKPQNLTVYDDLGERIDREKQQSFSGQMS
jgi:hypothetical protein